MFFISLSSFPLLVPKISRSESTQRALLSFSFCLFWKRIVFFNFTACPTCFLLNFFAFAYQQKKDTTNYSFSTVLTSVQLKSNSLNNSTIAFLAALLSVRLPAHLAVSPIYTHTDTFRPNTHTTDKHKHTRIRLNQSIYNSLVLLSILMRVSKLFSCRRKEKKILELKKWKTKTLQNVPCFLFQTFFKFLIPFYLFDYFSLSLKKKKKIKSSKALFEKVPTKKKNYNH